MNIKAQGLLNACKWVEDEYGREALRDVIRACSVPVRERYMTAIPIDWHPVDEFIEFLEKSDEMLGRGSGKVAEQIGAAGARANMKGVLVRFIVYLTQPEFLMKRVAGLWRQFNDEGEMELIHFDKSLLQVEVRGMLKPHRLFCASLTGWCREVVAAAGAQNPAVRHVLCVTRGQKRCVWEARYTGLPGEHKRGMMPSSPDGAGWPGQGGGTTPPPSQT